MIRRYAGDFGFGKEYVTRLVEIYRKKMPYLIKYDWIRKRNIFKHIVYGIFPNLCVIYSSWKKKHSTL